MNKRDKPTGLTRIVRAFGYSWQGFRYAWREEAAFRQELCLALAVVPAGLYLGRSGVERALLVAPVVQQGATTREVYLPAGAELEGRVTRVESAGMAGRAKLWLTFDYLHARFGKLPIVAEVSSIPGDHSVKSSVTKEGLIEGRSSSQEDAAEAAAAAAALGALKGMKDKDKKEAAEAAAIAALSAYLAESGRGHELNFPRGVKFELELQRALYLLKE